MEALGRQYAKRARALARDVSKVMREMRGRTELTFDEFQTTWDTLDRVTHDLNEIATYLDSEK